MSTSDKNRSPFLSQLYLPKLVQPVNTILEYLVIRFPHLSEEMLISRMNSGSILFADGTPISISSPYQYDIKIFYYRENDQESEIDFPINIIYQNDEIVVVDKPHFLPVIPSGKYVNYCLLSWLVRKYQHRDFTPIHRLDRETAGLVLFSKNIQTRSRYHNLFKDNKVTKKYHAICHINSDPIDREWTVNNRIVTGEPWYRSQIVDGEINAISHIQLLDIKDGKALFNLSPVTGKKHQLRLHLGYLGFNIVNDKLYPTLVEGERDNINPLQLLAYSLSFIDPISGDNFNFISQQKLEW